MEKKTLRFPSVKHSGVRVLSEQLLLEGFEVRQRSRSLRFRIGIFEVEEEEDVLEEEELEPLMTSILELWPDE